MKYASFLFTAILILVFINNLFADGRKFTRSYTAHTLEANEFEFELLYLNKFNKMSGSYSNYKSRFEIEYGIFDRLTASFYFNFDGTSTSNNSFESESFRLESNSVELIYRLTDEGEEIIDPALYFEFEFGSNIIGYEPKILLSKNYKNFSAVLNISSEFERETNTNERETSFEITGGVSYQFSDLIGGGIELRHSRIYQDVFKRQFGEATFLGPTVNIAAGKFNLAINIMRQISGSPITKNGLELINHEQYEFSATMGLEI